MRGGLRSSGRSVPRPAPPGAAGSVALRFGASDETHLALGVRVLFFPKVLPGSQADETAPACIRSH